MRIDDILQQENFKELDSFLTKEMQKYAGDSLVTQMKLMFGSELEARAWFYSPSIALDSQRPYDYCKDGKINEIKDLLARIEYGVYS